MPAEFVVDASAVAKLFLDEAGSKEVREWWYRSLGSGSSFIAPNLLRYEVGNIVIRNLTRHDAATQRRAWREALAGVQFVDALHRTFEVAGLTFYDRAYVALAAERNAPLVTFDGLMTEAAERLGVTIQTIP